mmetsp:Transcript_19757/g.30482  ORF Transcript_19757/g.30482 Transcript_19757/m.30482 type:complete len:213 (+) Transcript_19757:164-802(+)|eukprot:CAMPEP_0195294670 /NCGR_PEP_ID=MMETSP0707-20130614/15673_1 /TAXON_ID=33640 /ORGANISM="Asterionellopsis glacialis, Strain CCMP134" /LENGTH=212 /DNA_ID=CAMNT_0040355707 /DNA_START=162 /DNA_END=803 /DNA_ORIENTATION=-
MTSSTFEGETSSIKVNVNADKHSHNQNGNRVQTIETRNCSSLASQHRTLSTTSHELVIQTSPSLQKPCHIDQQEPTIVSRSSNTNNSNNSVFANFESTRIHDKKAYCSAMQEAVRLLQREKVLLQKTTYFSVETSGTEQATSSFNHHDESKLPKKKHYQTKNKKNDKVVLKKLKKTVAGLCRERDKLWYNYEPSNINTANTIFAKKLSAKGS